MKTIMKPLILIFALTSAFAFAFQASEAEQMKADLVGKLMGGREKAWKFQSVEQIKELTIRGKKEEANRRVYQTTLKLQDPRSPGAYQAEAAVIYEKVDSNWEVKVGLKSLKKIE